MAAFDTWPRPALRMPASFDEKVKHTRQTTVVPMDGVAVLHALHHVIEKSCRAEQQS